VVMLQRSPTYVISRPAKDPLAVRLQRRFSPKLAYSIVRWKNVWLGMVFYVLSRVAPRMMQRWLLDEAREALGPNYDMSHFTPRYAVWDQRVCLVPDGDLFAAIRKGGVEVVTDHIETFTERGLRLRSGRELDADIVVTATGLEMQVLGGVEFTVDDRKIELNRTMNYKGALFSDVPNLACTFGYTNASWTLKADLTAGYICRLLQHMDAIGVRQVTPRRTDPSVHEEPFFTFSSGYIQRAVDRFPRQGSKRPFRLYQNYVLDRLMLRHGAVEDGALEFGNPKVAAEPAAVATLPAPETGTRAG
jgi:monooxygenase